MGADRDSGRRVPHGDNEALNFYAELTRSRDWKITRADYRHMSLDEMHIRAWGIVYCLGLMIFVVIWTWRGEFTKYLGLDP